MIENTNIFSGLNFSDTNPFRDLLQQNLYQLAEGTISEKDFFENALVDTALDQVGFSGAMKQNILGNKSAQKIALDTIIDRFKIPFDVKSFGDKQFQASKDIPFGPGSIRAETNFADGDAKSNISYNVRDYKISPSTTARLQANIDDDKRYRAEAGLRFRPNKKSYVDTSISYEKKLGPAFNINFERKF